MILKFGLCLEWKQWNVITTCAKNFWKHLETAALKIVDYVQVIISTHQL